MAATHGTVNVRINADTTDFMAAIRRAERSMALLMEARKLSAKVSRLTARRDALPRHRVIARFRANRARRAVALQLHEVRTTLDLMGNGCA